MEQVFKSYLEKNGHKNFDLKAVLFDMDGVLYDSMKWHAKSWYETMNKYGIMSTPEEFYMYEGMVGTETINHIIKREKGRDATDAEKQEIYNYKSDLFAQYNDQALIPFALDLVRKVDNEGYTTVIVTGSGQPTLIDMVCNSFENIFTKDKMVTALDVTNGKPHPEPFLRGLEKAGGLLPNQAIVIENAPMGIEAAVAAGIFTIAINTGPLDPEVLKKAGANIVLPSMEALSNNIDNYLKIIETVSL